MSVRHIVHWVHHPLSPGLSKDLFGEEGMNRTPYMLLIFFIIVLPVIGSAAPVGNIGDPVLWNPGPFQTEGGLSVITTLTYERQTNRLPSQITRFAWANPEGTPPEERHYPQTRWSKNTMDIFGVKLGIPFRDKVVVYGVIGSSDLTVNLHYEDWTVSRKFESNDTFESGPGVFFGIGTSLIIQRGEYQKIPLTLGMDMSYRRYSIEENRIGGEGLYYSSTLDEFQLAFCLSAEAENFSPYIGVKVASITGTEDYINKNYATNYFDEGYIHYNQDITWSKNLGYFMGVTTSIKGFVTVGIEFRGGDENAMGINATTRF